MGLEEEGEKGQVPPRGCARGGGRGGGGGAFFLVVFLAAAGFLAALFFLAAALGFLAAVFFLAMVFLTGDFFCGARQGAGQPSVRAHCTGSGGTPSLRASNCDRDSAVRRTGRRRAVGESYTGAAFAPRHPPPRAPERLLAAMGLGGSLVGRRLVGRRLVGGSAPWPRARA